MLDNKAAIQNNAVGTPMNNNITVLLDKLNVPII